MFFVVVVVVGLIKTVVMVLFVRKVWLVCFVVDVVVVVGKNKSNSGLVVWRLCCCFVQKFHQSVMCCTHTNHAGVDA